MNQTESSLRLARFLKYFPDEKACFDLIQNLLSKCIVTCISCRWMFLPDYKKTALECPRCRHPHTFTPGFILQKSRLPLHVRFAMIWLLTVNNRNMNTRETGNILQLKSYRTTWLWMQKIITRLTFFPDFPPTDEIETDSFTFRIKSKAASGAISSKEVEILVIISRLRREFRLLRMHVLTNLTKPEKNQLIRAALPYGGILYVPDNTWFYSDETGKYKVRSGKKNHAYSPYCKMPLPAMVALEWHRWVTTNFRNNIQEDHLQGYLNAFVFYFNRPKTTTAFPYFVWIIEELLGAVSTEKPKPKAKPRRKKKWKAKRGRSYY